MKMNVPLDYHKEKNKVWSDRYTELFNYLLESTNHILQAFSEPLLKRSMYSWKVFVVDAGEVFSHCSCRVQNSIPTVIKSLCILTLLAEMK